jgi:hypothetical protein
MVTLRYRLGPLGENQLVVQAMVILKYRLGPLVENWLIVQE